MSLIPDTTSGKIEFFESKNSPWAANAVAIGTTAGAVTALATKTAAARAKLTAQIAAQAAAKNATAELRAAVTDMMGAGGDIIKQIRTKAALDGDTVYFLAQIPAPADPSPVPAPGTPSNFKVGLEPDGSLSLKWKCANPVGSTGTTYQVFRKIGAASSFTFLGSTGLKKWPDTTLPNGSAQVTYQIVAVRSTVSGTAAQFIVNFGVGGSGEMTASVVEAPRMAA